MTFVRVVDTVAVVAIVGGRHGRCLMLKGKEWMDGLIKRRSGNIRAAKHTSSDITSLVSVWNHELCDRSPWANDLILMMMGALLATRTHA